LFFRDWGRSLEYSGIPKAPPFIEYATDAISNNMIKKSECLIGFYSPVLVALVYLVGPDEPFGAPCEGLQASFSAEIILCAFVL
jgi:hypothetical protein